MLTWKRKKPSNTNRFPSPFDVCNEPPGADYRGIPTYVCMCGYDMFLICTKFDPETREPGMWFMDGMCSSCGALVTVACPADTKQGEHE